MKIQSALFENHEIRRVYDEATGDKLSPVANNRGRPQAKIDRCGYHIKANQALVAIAQS